MTDEKNNAEGISPEDNTQSLDEMLDQIIDGEVENDAEPSVEAPVSQDTETLDEDVPDTNALPSDAEIDALLASDIEPSPEEQAAQQKKRQVMWTIFGVAIILAIILPAAFVFLKARSIASNTTQQQTTIIPVKNNGSEGSSEATSTETTKTALVTENSEEPENREVDLEEWNYYVNGFNIFAPAKGPRATAADGVNPTYEATLYDALDIYINEANAVQITIPKISGVEKVLGDENGDVVPTTDNVGGSTTTDIVISPSGSSTTTKVTRIYLDAIGSTANNKVAVWAVGKTPYQTTVGEMIGKTGWKVTKITATTATITNSSKTYTLRVGGSTVK